MTHKQILQCNQCGNVLGILATGKESMVCCGQLMDVKTLHINPESDTRPTVIRSFPGVEVKVVSQLNYIEEKQAIERIEVQTGKNLFKIYFDTNNHELSHYDIADV